MPTKKPAFGEYSAPKPDAGYGVCFEVERDKAARLEAETKRNEQDMLTVVKENMFYPGDNNKPNWLGAVPNTWESVDTPIRSLCKSFMESGRLGDAQMLAFM
jgi:hypothetical protein